MAARVIRDLPTRPVVDDDTVARRYHVSRHGAREVLARSAEDGVLGEQSSSRTTKAGPPRRMYSRTELVDPLSNVIME